MFRVPVLNGTGSTVPFGPTGGVPVQPGLPSFPSDHPTGGVFGFSLQSGGVVQPLHNCICPLLSAPGLEIICEWTGDDGVNWRPLQRPRVSDYE